MPVKKIISIIISICILASFFAGCGANRTEELTHTQSTESLSDGVTAYSEVPATDLQAKMSDNESPTSVPESSIPDVSKQDSEPTLPPEEYVEEADSEPNSLDLPKGHIKGCYESTVFCDYLDYYLFIPEGATENMPLVIYLHGDGDVGRMGNLLCNGVPLFATWAYGDNYPFLILTPSTRTTSWIDGTIPGTLMELIAHIAEEYKVDQEKIIITGHSRGAIGVWYLINEHGDYFSAAVPVSCDSDIPENHNYEMFAQVPIRAFVGTGDLDEKEIIEPMRSYIDATQQAGGDAELTIVQWATHSQTPERSFTKETFEWMLTQ